MKRALLLFAIALPLFAETKIGDVAWMAGRWGATIDGWQMEEVWLPPAGGMMLGIHRDVKGAKSSFEFFRIAEAKDGVVYFAQPSGKAPTPFTLIEVSATRAVFANPEHDFPQRIIYTLVEGRLCARVEGAGERTQEWCWAKQ